MKPITLQPKDPDVELPDVLTDVFVFGQIAAGNDYPEWYMGYFSDEHDEEGRWYLTDTHEPAIAFHRVYAWAEIPPDDPRTPDAPKVAAAA